MITKQEARTIAIEYLAFKQREYEEVLGEETITLTPNHKVLYGDRAGEIKDTYSVCYLIEWGLDFSSCFIKIEADTGDVLYTMSSTGWLEEQEDRFS